MLAHSSFRTGEPLQKYINSENYTTILVYKNCRINNDKMNFASKILLSLW